MFIFCRHPHPVFSFQSRACSGGGGRGEVFLHCLHFFVIGFPGGLLEEGDGELGHRGVAADRDIELDGAADLGGGRGRFGLAARGRGGRAGAAGELASRRAAWS